MNIFQADEMHSDVITDTMAVHYIHHAQNQYIDTNYD